MSKIGANIKKLREERGWTQLELSRIAGMGWKYLGAIEVGTRDPGRTTVRKLSEAFGVDEKTILYGDRRETSDADLRLLQEETERVFEMVKARSQAAKHSFMAKMLKALEEESL